MGGVGWLVDSEVRLPLLHRLVDGHQLRVVLDVGRNHSFVAGFLIVVPVTQGAGDVRGLHEVAGRQLDSEFVAER